MNKRTLFIGIFLYSICWACEEWDLEIKDFFRVVIVNYEAETINSIKISAKIEDWEVSPFLDDHGFIWSISERIPSLFFNDGKVSLNIRTIDDPPDFSTVITSLQPNTPHTIISYIMIGDSVYYSEPITFSTGKGEVITTGVNYKMGYDIELFGRLSGTESGTFAVKHGFCWSSNTAAPTLQNINFNIGSRRNDDPFSYVWNGLENNIPYYFRAFAIYDIGASLDTTFGEVIFFDGDLSFSTQRLDFEGGYKEGAVGFSIGNKGYLGTGNNGNGATSDFWEYDPDTDTWTQLSDFTGGIRESAVGFSIGNKGYLGTGNNENGATSDFWEYNPQTDTWTQLSDFAGGIRESAIGFSIGNKGYLGTGRDRQCKNDFWEFNPQTNSWVEKASIEGDPREDGIGFSIGSIGYLGLGYDCTLLRKNDFWKYIPQSDTWVKRSDFGGLQRSGSAGFIIGNRYYIGPGNTGSFVKRNDFWEFDP